MRLVIDHGHCRRVIDGGFNIIASPQDLREVARQIMEQIGDDPDNYRFSYGTIYIRDRGANFGPANTPPKAWDE